ncbi:Basic helix-loop-helix transcription factor [Parasponia andersonii]|uniref:Basic helix-loop-helix transcription factor n=1 Tax=Parasponia andersonii TaxID=3476 RepID=A0A2P5CPB1_PARAD|nr:Basic helix-loop-helix transcription factor [Parasponia andersonii]
MATEPQNEEGVLPDNLNKRIALAVRSIQWSYAIFWSISSTQPGVLEWEEGYYNGDIKTRKTTQAIELNADEMGLQRSEQLSELYDSLSAGETSPQAKRPSAALSPEDLSDAEWYYLVCMSFVFNIGQGLPGRALANGQPIWLYNAHYADSKVFSRSLLAKSASIQTVVCFPLLGGVIELGTTDLVVEDCALIQQVKMSILEIPCPVSYKKSDCSAGNTRNDHGFAYAAVDHDLLNTNTIPVVVQGELIMSSPSGSSDGFEPNQPAVDSLMEEGLNGAVSQVQSWQIMDEELSNCVNHSMDSSDCISQTLVDPEKFESGPKHERVEDHALQDRQVYNHTKMSSLDLQSEDLHYQSVISTLLKSSHQLILGPHFQKFHHESSFVGWRKRGVLKLLQPTGGTSQKLVKKILFEVPRMHLNCIIDSPEDDCIGNVVWRPEADEIGMNHALSERRRRERLNEKFSILKMMVPSLSNEDKVSVLDDAIQYLKELKRRVEELESGRESTDLEPKTKRKPQDAREGTSDNYGNKKISSRKEQFINKRKARDMDEVEPEIHHDVSKDSSAGNIAVIMKNKDVLIKINCPWREGVLLEIMDALSNLHLDSHSVQSSTMDGIISLTIQSMIKCSAPISVATIKQALQKIAWNC